MKAHKSAWVQGVVLVAIFFLPLNFSQAFNKQKPNCQTSSVVRYIDVSSVPLDPFDGVSGGITGYPSGIAPSTCPYVAPTYVWGSSANPCVTPFQLSNVTDRLEILSANQGIECKYLKYLPINSSNRLQGYICLQGTNAGAGAWNFEYPLGVEYIHYITWDIGCRMIYYIDSQNYSARRGYVNSPYRVFPANCPPDGPIDAQIFDGWGNYGSNVCLICS